MNTVAGRRLTSLRLNSLLDEKLTAGTKGLPPTRSPLALGDIGRQGWNLLHGDLPLPAAVLKETALAHNSRVMREFAARTSVWLCPHGKTTMSPQLFDRQFADGAWGLTAATIAHLESYRHYGVQRVLFANQLIDPVGIGFVVDELHRDPRFDFFCLVDSIASVDLLARHARKLGARRPIQVLIEAGISDGRTGARSIEEALAVASRAATLRPWLSVRGVECFEGIFSGASDAAARSGVTALLEATAAIVDAAAAQGLFASEQIIVSAGGSAFFETVVHELRMRLGFPKRLVLRSGCYLIHDHGHYERALARPDRVASSACRISDRLIPALEVWGYIQSRPEPGLVLANVGKRDVSHDIDLPKAISWYRPGLHAGPQQLPPQLFVTALNDQHAYLAVPSDHPLQVGDMIGFGISHPCTTFDKWRVILMVQDDYSVTGAIRTLF